MEEVLITCEKCGGAECICAQTAAIERLQRENAELRLAIHTNNEYLIKTEDEWEARCDALEAKLVAAEAVLELKDKVLRKLRNETHAIARKLRLYAEEAADAAAIDAAKTGVKLDALSALRHVVKRLSDEFGIELDSTWFDRVKAGEHDVTFPSAALAERDRVIEKRTAARCAEIVSGYIYSGCHALQAHIRRVFNLEPKPKPSGLCSRHRDGEDPNCKICYLPKPEGDAAFFGTWPGEETDKDLHDAAKEIL